MFIFRSIRLVLAFSAAAVATKRIILQYCSILFPRIANFCYLGMPSKTIGANETAESLLFKRVKLNTLNDDAKYDELKKYIDFVSDQFDSNRGDIKEHIYENLEPHLNFANIVARDLDNENSIYWDLFNQKDSSICSKCPNIEISFSRELVSKNDLQNNLESTDRKYSTGTITITLKNKQNAVGPLKPVCKIILKLHKLKEKNEKMHKNGVPTKRKFKVIVTTGERDTEEIPIRELKKRSLPQILVSDTNVHSANVIKTDGSKNLESKAILDVFNNKTQIPLSDTNVHSANVIKTDGSENLESKAILDVPSNQTQSPLPVTNAHSANVIKTDGADKLESKAILDGFTNQSQIPVLVTNTHSANFKEDVEPKCSDSYGSLPQSHNSEIKSVLPPWAQNALLFPYSKTVCEHAYSLNNVNLGSHYFYNTQDPQKHEPTPMKYFPCPINEQNWNNFQLKDTGYLPTYRTNFRHSGSSKMNPIYLQTVKPSVSPVNSCVLWNSSVPKTQSLQEYRTHQPFNKPLPPPVVEIPRFYQSPANIDSDLQRRWSRSITDLWKRGVYEIPCLTNNYQNTCHTGRSPCPNDMYSSSSNISPIYLPYVKSCVNPFNSGVLRNSFVPKTPSLQEYHTRQPCNKQLLPPVVEIPKFHQSQANINQDCRRHWSRSKTDLSNQEVDEISYLLNNKRYQNNYNTGVTGYSHCPNDMNSASSQNSPINLQFSTSYANPANSGMLWNSFIPKTQSFQEHRTQQPCIFSQVPANINPHCLRHWSCTDLPNHEVDETPCLPSEEISKKLPIKFCVQYEQSCSKTGRSHNKIYVYDQLNPAIITHDYNKFESPAVDGHTRVYNLPSSTHFGIKDVDKSWNSVF